MENFVNAKSTLPILRAPGTSIEVERV